MGSLANDGLVATGSHDVTVLLWKWSGKLNRVVSQLHTPQGIIIIIILLYFYAKIITGSVTPLAILNGHEQSVTCVAVSATHGLIVSGSKCIITLH